MEDVKKVAVIGPECTGKSELSQFLASYFNTVWVPEFARDYIDGLSRPYQENDLALIARGQLDLEDECAAIANKVLICDTNLYVIKIWSEFKFGKTDPEILKQIQIRKYDLYLLTYIDLPWIADGQREHPAQQKELYNMYHREMQGQYVPFKEIRGSRPERRKSAIRAIEKLLSH